MGTTLGTALVLAGSMLHFGALDEILIGLLMFLNAPVSYTLTRSCGAVRAMRNS